MSDSQKCRAGYYPFWVGLKGGRNTCIGFRHYKPQAAGKQLLVMMESAVKISFGVADFERDVQIRLQWWHC